MEAPKCSICEKRHYGLCADAVVPKQLRERKKAKNPFTKTRTSPSEQIDAGTKELLGRIQVLEKIVAELCGFRKKRSEYMKQYMRDRRAALIDSILPSKK